MKLAIKLSGLVSFIVNISVLALGVSVSVRPLFLPMSHVSKSDHYADQKDRRPKHAHTMYGRSIQKHRQRIPIASLIRPPFQILEPRNYTTLDP